ncbi:hypothetical protein KX407_27635 [Escherichia coli]|nr:hypothetical protein [Escherichia coli]
MAKIRYLQGTHDARAGDIRDVAQPCAEVLVRLGKAEYISKRKLTAVCSHQTRIGNLDAHLI